MRRFVVVSNVPESTEQLLPFAEKTRGLLFNSIYVTNPTPSIPELDADIAKLKLAEANKGSTTMEALNLARQTVRNALDHERGAVQIVVDTKATIADAAAIAESVGMRLRGYTKPSRPAFSAGYGGVEGAVLVRVKYLRGAVTNYWQFSLNQTDWTTVQETHKSSVLMTGLPPGQQCFFRFRRLVGAALTEWSDSIVYRVR